MDLDGSESEALTLDMFLCFFNQKNLYGCKNMPLEPFEPHTP